MRSGRLLLRVPAALRPGTLRVLAAGLALALVLPASAAATPASPPAGPGGAPPPGAHLPPPPGTTSLVSARFGGGFAGGPSAEPSISSSSRWIAFTSGAPNLVPGDTNDALDVFVRDRRDGSTIRLGLPSGAPVPPGGRASEPSISANGQVVAFTYQPPSSFSAVVAGSIVLAWDRSSGDVEAISKGLRGTTTTGRSPSVSSDGRFVAYVSDDRLIVPNDLNAASDVFRYDRTSGRTVLISADPSGVPAPGASSDPSISADGNLVAFVSEAGDGIVDEDTGSGRQVYLRDVEAGRTERISGAPGGGTGGAPADGESESPSISADGRYVAFDSFAGNLVGNDANGVPDVFRRDREAGVTVLVSVTPDGTSGKGPSGEGAISGDGRVVAFTSAAIDLVTAGLEGADLAALVVRASEVYARDVDAEETVLVSVAAAGGPGGGRSLSPTVSSNGRFVAFASLSPVLVDGDTNKVSDVFLRDMPPVPVINPPVLDLGTRAIGAPGVPGAATLANTGWGPLSVTGATVTGPAAPEFTVEFDGCAGALLRRGEACTVTVAFTPATEGARTATLEIADAVAGSPRTVRLRGLGSLARLELSPAVGEPGVVVIATGTDFPPDTDLRLSWSGGITPTMPVVRSDADGGFRVPVLVFHNDQTGIRDLVATPVDSTAFPAVAAPMLVSAPSVAPPGFLIRPPLDLPFVLLIRG